jgi:hypothetical protein
MAVSVRIRFEIFKRDDFTCRYCGKRSPEVVLEIDHIVPVCEGGIDDPINLAVACWDCNRGKAGIPLSETMTGEDPHDRAILLLENERQLREYNEVLRAVNERVEVELEELCNYWKFYTYISLSEKAALRSALQRFPNQLILRAMFIAVDAKKTASLAYVFGCLNNWQQEAQERKNLG